jgi:hypothetical protein
MLKRLGDVVVVGALVAASVAWLEPGLRQVLADPWQESFWAVLPDTARAAVKVWTFWGVAAALLGAVLLRSAPGLGLLDATLGGAAGVWVLAYVGGNLLGPIGLFRSWTVWALLAGAAIWLWRAGPPRIERRPLSPGLKLALWAFAVAAPGLLALQLGSPLPPHMDTLAPPASAQRIVTFGRYFPFDNDPFGYWDAASQCPGVELLYALLALGSGTSLAVLAETAAMVPMAALLFLATYRLGRAVGGDVAGGMAAWLLFATVFIRTFPFGHGRYVTFALVSAGLALFLDTRGNRLRPVLAALVMGTAVASHAIIGALGMAAAAGPVLLWLLRGRVVAALAGAGVLAGASLIAVPTIAIGLRLELPYPVLPLAQALGVALAAVAARGMPARAATEGVIPRALLWALTLAVLAALVRPPPEIAMLRAHVTDYRYPTLYLAAGLGLACMLWWDFRGRALLAPVVTALAAGMGAEYAAGRWWTTFADPNVQVAVEGFIRKVDFWYPWVLVLPAACFAAWLYQTLSPRLAVYALLAALLFPWIGRKDPNYYQHSIVEGLAYQLELAKNGYWSSTGDRRWAQSPAQLELIEILRGEIAAGRITPATHVVHVTPYIYLYKDTVLFSVYTGINDDLYVAGFIFDRSTAGGRFYPVEKLEAALAERPPYVVVHDVTADGRTLADELPELPAAVGEYEVLLDRDGVRLLRYPAG